MYCSVMPLYLVTMCVFCIAVSGVGTILTIREILQKKDKPLSHLGYAVKICMYVLVIMPILDICVILVDWKYTRLNKVKLFRKIHGK